ncbi:MAG: hypothetical protein GY798_30605 [Hyphomicrobiales bacterium]|nr:hypothetical protein [Hyphomicrobiales bacterium]
MNGNTIHLNLGATDGDRPDDPMRVIIAARLRLTPDFARKLHGALEHILKEKPPKRGRTKAIVSADPPTKAIN